MAEQHVNKEQRLKLQKKSHLPVRREHIWQHDAKWSSPFRALLKLEKRALKIGNSTVFILLQEKMSKKKLNCFKETEQLHGYTEAQRRVVKDVELS